MGARHPWVESQLTCGTGIRLSTPPLLAAAATEPPRQVAPRKGILGLAGDVPKVSLAPWGAGELLQGRTLCFVQ